MSKSYNVDIAEFLGYLAPHDSFAIFTPIRPKPLPISGM